MDKLVEMYHKKVKLMTYITVNFRWSSTHLTIFSADQIEKESPILRV